MSEVLIKVENLTKKFGDVVPLNNVNFEIRKGDIISVIGPSGTGKSTLLHTINRLETPDSGKIIFHGENITDPNCDTNAVRRKIGMIFQSFNLFSHLNVIENITVAPIELKKIPKESACERAKELLKSVGLLNKAYNYPDELSGGQQQRVAIVRGLAMEPEILLFDEPTSALDPTMVGEVETVIRRVAESGTTMMIVTHSIDFARQISNRVFYMDEGGIYEEGTPKQIFDNPQREKTRQFIHRLKILEFVIDSRDFDFPGTYTKFEEFALQNGISRKQKNNLFSIFEEIAVNILLPALPENPVVKIKTEYSKKNDVATIFFDYNGEKFDIMTGGDEIALAIIKGRAGSMEYDFDETAELKNRLKIVVK